MQISSFFDCTGVLNPQDGFRVGLNGKLVVSLVLFVSEFSR
jgi:hypothetical protein